MKTLEEQSEEFLQSKDIWNHPFITDRTESNGYEVRQLLEDFARQCVHKALEEVEEKILEELRWGRRDRIRALEHCKAHIKLDKLK